MKKAFILAAAALLGATPVAADNYNYLTVKCTGAEQSISLPTIQKITFGHGNAVVTTTDKQTFTYPLAELQKMSFTATATAIEALPTQEKDLAYRDGTLTVSGNGMLHIYNASGALVQMAKVEKGARISLDTLPRGVYIVNMGQQTIKVSK